MSVALAEGILFLTASKFEKIEKIFKDVYIESADQRFDFSH